MIDVLFVHYGAPWLRGSERCVLEAAAGLDRSRFRAHLLCNEEPLRDAALARGIPAERIAIPEIMIDGRERRLEIGAWLRCTREIVSRARGVGADVLYANSGRAAQATWLAARRLGLPRIAHLHAPYYRRYHWLWGLWDADLVVFPCDATRRVSLGGRRLRGATRVVPNGVDLERFCPAAHRDPALRRALGFEQEALVIGQIGSLIHRKGADVLLDAFSRLRDCEQAFLVLAGGGPERDALEAQAVRLGVAARVRFPGEIDDPADWLRNVIDVNVLASREESLPLSLLEAAACGVATICTCVGGTSEIVSDSKTGLLVGPDDVAGLATAIERLAGDAGFRAELGARARERAERSFGIGSFVGGVAQAIESVIAPARQRA